jgi:F-type H+-transporting ATPase subunit alpha
MAVTLFAVNRGYLDDVDVKRALAFEAALHSHIKNRYGDLLNKIETTKDLDADGEKALAAAIEDFKKNWA